MSERSRLRAKGLTVGYGGRPVLDWLDLALTDGAVTAIIGPNACGKSTLLRSLARLHRPQQGAVFLDGAEIGRRNSRAVARELAILTQNPSAPDSMSVGDLVGRGRTPHQSALRQWTKADGAAVADALEATGLTALAARPIAALSGGQRQRAWIAMALAQNTALLLLDEPTTFLDLPHQVALLDLIRAQNRESGRTVAMVLHDINLAARFADFVVTVKAGQIRRHGPADEAITQAEMREVFGLECRVIEDPIHGTPHVIPA